MVPAYVLLRACKTGSVCSVNKPTGPILACFVFFVCVRTGDKVLQGFKILQEKSVFFESNVFLCVCVYLCFLGKAFQTWQTRRPPTVW